VRHLKARHPPLGHGNKVASAQQPFGSRAAPAGCRARILGAGHAPHQPHRKIRFDQGPQQGRCGLLRGSDDVNASLTPALRQARQWFLHALAAHHQQVGQFINDDHDRELRIADSSTAFHQMYQALECLRRFFYVSDDRTRQVGQPVEETKSVAFGIYQHHSD